MVCKEELFLWFKSLKGSKRIEVICGLLNMCCPLELRFCATCMEELCSRDYYCLRNEEDRANNINEVSKIKNIWDVHSRSKLIVALSLLHSTNFPCSNVIYNILAEEMKVETLASSGALSDPKCAEELLLLLTMAQNHPAFTFEQQMYLSDLCIAVENYVQQATEIESSSSIGSLIPSVTWMSPILIQDCGPSVCHRHKDLDPSSYSVSRSQDNQYSQANITSLKGKAPHKKMAFRIRVGFGANKVIDVFKTPYEIAVFHQKLMQSFPQDKYSPNKEKYIPHLPPIINSCGKQEALNDSLTASLTEYIWQLNCHLPSYIMQSDNVVSFFLPSGHGRSGMTRNNRNVEAFSPDESKSPRLRSLTIYNSHISESSPAKRMENRQRMVSQPSSSPSSQQLPKKVAENGGPPSMDSSPSVMSSPVASPYVSPPSSQTNSRSVSPWIHRVADRSTGAFTSENYAFEKLLMKEHLHEYWDILKHYRIEELQSMTQEELEAAGITKDVGAKLRRIIDSVRSYAPPNGLNSQIISRNSASLIQGTIKMGMSMQNISSESSPVCSEYSSPSQSPSPSEICNQNSSNSSSSEETSAEKGTPSKSRGDMPKMGEFPESAGQESLSKKLDDNLSFVKNGRDGNNRQPVVPLPVGYGSVQLPVQTHKPSFLPLHCRTNTGLHISPGSVIFDSQFSRVPLPSALTFLPHMPSSTQRSHAGTPERALSSSTGLPVTTLCPFPVVTSACATVPSATCSFATNKSGNVTVVTNCVATGTNGVGRQAQKAVQPSHDSEPLPKPPLCPQSESLYTHNSGYMLPAADGSVRPSSASTSSCLCASNVARPSPAPSPSLSPASTPQQGGVPVSLPYIGLPYVLHHSIPFIQTHTGAPANGFMQPAALPTAGHGFTYALPNGVSAIAPEILYSAQAFAAQSPSLSQGTPTLIAPTVSQCYGSYPPTVTASSVGAAHLVKVPTCYNCGKVGHRGPECKEQSMDEMCKTGKFQLNYAAAASVKCIESNE